MAEYSKIDYLLAQNDAEVLRIDKDGTRYNGGTWSPWIGCDKGGRAGCANCWAEMWARRNPRFRGHWGRNAPRYFFGEEHWKQPLRWQRKCERLGVRKRVLVSLCDPFEDRTELHEHRDRLGRLIAGTPLLDWLLLTKRPGRITRRALRCFPDPLPDNLWLGVSCWDQPSADRNIPLLLEVPAALHWVSFEPLLGPVDVNRHLYPLGFRNARGTGVLGCLGWAVVGCESRGARAGRRCDVRWVEKLSAQCSVAGVPLFTKQLELPGWPGKLVKSDRLGQLGWPVQMPEPRG